MSYIVDILLTDLRRTIADLGKQGGLQNASIYDTAQVIRFATTPEAPWPAIEWLLSQQQADGGWGNPAVPRARHVPTLAAILALHRYALRRHTREAILAGVSFLRRQASVWSGPLPDDLPAGIELIIPHLLEDPICEELGISVPAYASLMALGKKRRALIAGIKLQRGTTPLHSWEAFGTSVDATLIDGTGSMGHSPSATAAWLRLASQQTELADACEAARSYLCAASAATGSDIPGLMPTNWPIDRFEQCFSLHALLLSDLLDHPGLHDVLQPQVNALAAAMLPSGLGFSDHFIADGDDTAAAIAVLHACGHAVPITALTRFQVDNHFVAWHNELQQSISVTARAAHALHRQGYNVEAPLNHLCQFQLPDGRWMVDKWHGSWLYSTGLATITLAEVGWYDTMQTAVDGMLAFQLPAGGWSANDSYTQSDTALAVMALLAVKRAGALNAAGDEALRRAAQLMLQHYRPFTSSGPYYWMAKEAYYPPRIERAFELSAMIGLAYQGYIPCR
jgi:hypothetical protein